MFRRLSPWKLYLIFGVFFVGGCFFTVFSWIHNHDFNNVRRLVREGKTVTGKVTTKEGFGRRTRGRYVEYTYTVDGREYKGRDRKTILAFKYIDVGAPIQVTYLPGNPSVASLDPQETLDNAEGARILSPIAAGFGFLGLFFTYLFHRRSVRAYSSYP